MLNNVNCLYSCFRNSIKSNWSKWRDCEIENDACCKVNIVSPLIFCTMVAGGNCHILWMWQLYGQALSNLIWALQPILIAHLHWLMGAYSYYLLIQNYTGLTIFWGTSFTG